jgi:hypothetical protein
MHPLSAKLKKIMKETPLTAIQIKNACDVTRGTVYLWLNKGYIDKKHFETLARISGTTIEWWLGNLKQEIEAEKRNVAREVSPEYLLINFDEETIEVASIFATMNTSQRAQAKAILQIIKEPPSVAEGKPLEEKAAASNVGFTTSTISKPKANH